MDLCFCKRNKVIMKELHSFPLQICPVRLYSSMQSSQILYTVVLQQEIICYAVSKTFIQLNWFQHLLRKCHSCCMTLCSRSDKSSRTHTRRWAVQRYITFIGYHPYCRKEEALHLHAIRCLVLICSQRKSVHSAYSCSCF